MDSMGSDLCGDFVEGEHMTFNRHLFSAALSAHMTTHKLTLREAAKVSGISASTLSRLTNGDAPDMDTFATLVRWLEVDSNVFLDCVPVNGVDERYARLYDALSALGTPSELTEAIVTIVQLVREQ
jgi:transcriptional regulator with XRE-family HTH domain